MQKYFFLSVFMLAGCGTDAVTPLIQIHFKLPASLKSPEARLQRLKSRSEYLVLKMKTKSGKNYENKFGPGSWGGIAVPDLNFPANDKDALEIHAAIWDRKRDGTLRTFPVLQGKLTLKASELSQSELTRVTVLLHLQIEPENFDQ